MALDLEKLLAPVSEDEPVGPDLSYDNDRYVIEQAFETEVSIDASGVASQASDTDWRQVINTIQAQSARTKDVWLAVYLSRAGAMSGDLETTEIGVKYLAGLLEQYWPSVHPQLEEYGFQGRKGACDSLAGLSQFINPLRRIRILRHPRLGEFTSEDFVRFRAGGDSEEGYGMFRAALEDVGQEGLQEIVGRLDAIHDAIKRADLILTSNAEGGTATNFQPTYEAVGEIKRAVLVFGGAPTEVEEETMADEGADDAATDGAGAASGGGGPRIAGRVDSREDVIRAVDAIADYYRRREPGHPMIMLLNRAREWINLDFMAILQDIAPSSVDEARNILLARTQRE